MNQLDMTSEENYSNTVSEISQLSHFGKLHFL